MKLGSVAFFNRCALLLAAAAAAVLLLPLSPAIAQAPSASPAATPDPAIAALADIRVVFHTAKGDIAAILFPSKAPLAVTSFCNLAQHKFYNGVPFHRVIHGFVAQGGDPDGSGGGGPGYEFKDEISPSLKLDKPGVLAMANHGENSNGSQFFIAYVPLPKVPGKYTIFGQVTESLPIVEKIEQGDEIQGIDVLDSTDPLFAAEAKQLQEWNTVLSAQPPRHAKPSPGPSPSPSPGAAASPKPNPTPTPAPTAAAAPSPAPAA